MCECQHFVAGDTYYLRMRRQERLFFETKVVRNVEESNGENDCKLIAELDSWMRKTVRKIYL